MADPGPAETDRQQDHPAPELKASALAEAFGGGRGLLDSGLPAAVFVVVRLVTGSLGTAIAVAVASGAVLLLLRVRRGETLQQVASGFFGLLLAVLVARATGTGKGFFLPGILTTAGTGLVFAVSLLARRPAVALGLAAYDERYAGWAQHRGLRRACTIATAVWTATFFVRAGIAYWVYSLPGDRDGLLLVVINVVKWPLIVLAAVLTVVLVKRSGFVPQPVEEPPA